MPIQEFYVSVQPDKNFTTLQKSKGVVVISPHPDDDVIGMGGFMAIKSQKQERVITIYVTDGAGSIRNDPKEKIRELRKQEALNALKAVRAEGAFFLNARSKWLSETSENRLEIMRNLHDILEYLSPSEVYITAPFELHTTHIHSSEIVVSILQKLAQNCPDISPALYGYPVWGPLLGQKSNILFVNASAVVEIKRAAILCHEGEVGYKPYHDGVLARNFSQAIFQDPYSANQAKYIEVFLNMSGLLKSPFPAFYDFARREAEIYVNQVFEKK